MSEPYLGEIKMIGFSFAPSGWALCDGQLLPIDQNQSLYSLLGTRYGGDGRTNFGLPDLRSRVAIHKDNSYLLGQKGGSETVTLAKSELPVHTHAFRAVVADADKQGPKDHLLATATEQVYRAPEGTMVKLRHDAMSSVGGGQGHNNMQPSLIVSFCIALQGLFPPRN